MARKCGIPFRFRVSQLVLPTYQHRRFAVTDGLSMSLAMKEKIMRKVSITIILAALFVLAGCGVPVPPEKLDYVGEWRSPQMAVLITQDGSLRYKRVEGSTTKSIEAPLKG